MKSLYSVFRPEKLVPSNVSSYTTRNDAILLTTTNISDEERDALLGAFTDFSTDTDHQISLKQRVLKPYFGLMMLFITLFIYVQVFRIDAVTHYALIYNLSMEQADALIKSKAIISLLGVVVFSVVFLLGKAITMFSLTLLVVFLSGFIDDITARLATFNAIQDMTMNVILVLRLAIIAALARISYLCIFRDNM